MADFPICIFFFRLVFYYKIKKVTSAQNKFLGKRKAHRQGNITPLGLYMAHQLNHQKKESSSSTVIFLSTCIEKKKWKRHASRTSNTSSKPPPWDSSRSFPFTGDDPRVKTRTAEDTCCFTENPPPISTDGEVFQLIPVNHRKSIKRMMKKASLRAIFPNILAAHQIDASKKIQSSIIHPTSNRDVRRETVDRVTNGSVNQR